MNRQINGCEIDCGGRSPHLIEFDIRGRVYPSTLLNALREVDNYRERIRSGAVKLLFRTDNPLCSLTIPDAASAMGHEVSISRDSDHFLIIIGSDNQ